jgi:hypothetical protein
VRDGVITSHRLYFDQMEFLFQLGLAERSSSDAHVRYAS